MNGSPHRVAAPVLLAVGLAVAAVCTASFPMVQGLGAKVRLPVFHGALTWVNLGSFTALALFAAWFLVGRRPAHYRIAEALRWLSIPLWVVGSALGLIAALQTWDFTGSSASPVSVVTADPRLMAQFWIAVAALFVLALDLVLDEPRWAAALDVGFVALMWIVLAKALLGPGRALHPDSPVLNSDEISIKLYFFGIVAGLSLAAFATVWMVARNRGKLDAGELENERVGE